MMNPVWRDHTIGVIDAMVVIDAKHKMGDVAIHNRRLAEEAANKRGKTVDPKLVKNVADEVGDSWPFVQEVMDAGLYTSADGAEQGDDGEGGGA